MFVGEVCATRAIINRKMHVIRFESADVLVQMAIQTHNHSLNASMLKAGKNIAHHNKKCETTT